MAIWSGAGALACFAPGVGQAARLPAVGADPAKTSVSGLSSGAFMAVQYDVAYSRATMGVGIVAGGPYNCAYVNFGGITACMQGAPLGSSSYGAAQAFAWLGEVDPVDNLKSQKVYMFSGTDDPVVRQSVMDAVFDFYRAAGTPEANIQYVKTFAAGHAFISANFSAACSTTATPFINACTSGEAPYDQPYAILNQIYGPLQPKATALSSQPMAFSQKEFASGLSGMAATGYVYTPAACKKGAALKCAVHVVFHGCGQSADKVGDDVYGKLGYNAWADTNRIVVLYPQVNASAAPFNPQGCWDWWGYTGFRFQTKSGLQLSAINAMIRRLT
jgi:poly(3-hydroxybutyrate) depolymerase